MIAPRALRPGRLVLALLPAMLLLSCRDRHTPGDDRGDSAPPAAPPDVAPAVADGPTVRDTGAAPEAAAVSDGPADQPDTQAMAPDAPAAPGPCGRLGQPCCRSAVCTEAGTSCGAGDTCQPCGPSGRGCCPGNTCPGGCCAKQGLARVCVRAGESCGALAGLCMDGGACGACGAIGQRCCVGRDCTAAGSTCDPATTTCVACGEPGQPCCGLTCKTPGHACDRSSRCAPCGAPGQPCCRGPVRCDDPATACALLPNSSEVGVCRTCGGPGQVCCTGDRCQDANTICLGARCEPCGAHGQLCCAGERCTGDGVSCFSREPCSKCSYCGSYCGSCRLCGGLGQTCCVDGSCRPPHKCSAQGACE